jgi:hypothetical protein
MPTVVEATERSADKGNSQIISSQPLSLAICDFFSDEIQFEDCV